MKSSFFVSTSKEEVLFRMKLLIEAYLVLKEEEDLAIFWSFCRLSMVYIEAANQNNAFYQLR